MEKKNLIAAGIGLAVILVGLMVMLLIPKKYTVTFDTTGGTILEELEVKKGTTIGDLEVPKKDGYTFLYWTLDGKVCSKTDKITKDIKLTAKWERDLLVNPDVKKYTVTFDSNGGSTINEVHVEEGKTLNEPSTPTKEGYLFVSWMLDNKTFDFNTTITKDITLVAKWEEVKEEVKTYTVTFSTDGGSKVSSKTVTEGNKVSKPKNPTKNGYTFVSWTLDGKEYNFNSKVTSNITLKATWKKVEEPKEEDKPVVAPTKYTVTFNTDGGSNVASQTIEENGKVNKPADPKKDGYTFKGWYVGSSEYNFNDKVTGNFTLTAKWEKVEEVKTYTISISKVDDYSTDRYVTVKENGVAIKVSKLMHTNGVEIPAAINGNRLSVAFIEIEDVTSFKVLLTNGKTVTANVE